MVFALLMRELYTRFGRDNIGFLWIIVEPILFCCAVVLLWTIIKSEHSIAVALVPFLLTGYMPLLMYRHTTARIMRCMQANSALLYHSKVTIFSMYTARIVLEVLSTITAFSISCFAFWIFGVVEAPRDVSLMLLGWGLYVWITVSVSILVGSLSERSELTEKIWQPLSYITIPLSGTFFMVDWLTPSMHDIAALMPMISAVELIRGGYFGDTVTVHYNLVTSFYFCLLVTVAGLFLLKDARRYVEVE
ncbi:ABC transporter permease [Rhizobium deserti]|uniref:ABC transporter permease n=1 Tax=Rhizobium deserti TaxID=2547961 RepID=UPI001386FC14|nr:ABC transporter permease [Rhizobium deserti]